MDYEVIILGGGASGISAAMTLGRMNRSVMVCDTAEPRNRFSAKMHNFIGCDGANPKEWYESAIAQVKKYPEIKFSHSAVEAVHPLPSGFRIILANKEEHTCKKILLAYGMRDDLPPISGFKEQWGKTIFNCPFCDAYEYVGKPLGVLCNNQFAEHVAILLSGLSDNVTIFTNADSNVTSDKFNVVDTKIASVAEGVINFIDDTSVECSAIFYPPTLPIVANCNFATDLGCDINEEGTIVVDENGRTSIESVFASGDIITLNGQSVMKSCSTGQMAAIGITFDLLA